MSTTLFMRMIFTLLEMPIMLGISYMVFSRFARVVRLNRLGIRSTLSKLVLLLWLVVLYLYLY